MNVFAGADHIITSLGFSTEENLEEIRSGKTGIKSWRDDALYPGIMPASRVDDNLLEGRISGQFLREGFQPSPDHFTRMERMFI